MNPHSRTRVIVVLGKIHEGGLGVQRTTVQEGKGMAEGEVAAALGVNSSYSTMGNGRLCGGGGGLLQAMSSGARCSEVMGARDLDAGCREARGRGSSHHGDREELGSPRALQAAGGGDARARGWMAPVEMQVWSHRSWTRRRRRRR